jgi:hypothetical protein
VCYEPYSKKNPYYLSVKTLAAQIRHNLKLKLGDSFVWQQRNPKTGYLEKRFLNFDDSGLDEKRNGDLARLIDYSTQTGLTGYNLLSEFALKYSVNNYVKVYRGNNVIITSDPKKAFEIYLRDFKQFN